MRYWQVLAYDCSGVCVGVAASYDNEAAALAHAEWLKEHSTEPYTALVEMCETPVLLSTFNPDNPGVQITPDETGTKR